MDEGFGGALLRLKQVLGVHSDKEVAEALGMKPTALNSRKARNSFPEDKLLALIARRPELGIDADYVMTGRQRVVPAGARPQPPPAPQPQHTAAEGRRGRYAPPINVPLMSACIQAVADEVAARQLALDHRAVTVIASSVYEMSLAIGKVNPRLAAPLLDVYLEGQKR